MHCQFESPVRPNYFDVQISDVSVILDTEIESFFWLLAAKVLESGSVGGQPIYQDSKINCSANAQLFSSFKEAMRQDPSQGTRNAPP